MPGGRINSDVQSHFLPVLRRLDLRLVDLSSVSGSFSISSEVGVAGVGVARNLEAARFLAGSCLRALLNFRFRDF